MIAASPAEFAGAVDRLEEAGVDSLWLQEMVFGSQIEPFVGMAHALSRTSRLKVGTGVSVLPGRHPVLVAKQLASLAGLAPGRVLPVFGLRPARDRERAVFAVPAGRRAAVFDESLELLRLLLSQETVSFAGEFFSVDSASVGPLPVKALDIWLGGSAPGALRRIGRFGDGWLASFVTPDEARAGREAIQAAAADAGREVDPEHFGISLAVVAGGAAAGESAGVARGGVAAGIPAELAAAVHRRRPGTDPASLVATSWPGARQMIEKYVAAGLSKFVVRPAVPAPFGPFLEDFVREMMPLQT
ncbi:MAG: TIGR03854 family LLM class F420-dependent oxidoreductase [Micromonosporaceae bacterium]